MARTPPLGDDESGQIKYKCGLAIEDSLSFSLSLCANGFQQTTHMRKICRLQHLGSLQKLRGLFIDKSHDHVSILLLSESSGLLDLSRFR
jgi:hypothetical protein